MSKHQRQSGWVNAYDVASPLSQAAEKRTRRKIAVAAHRFGTGGREELLRRLWAEHAPDGSAL